MFLIGDRHNSCKCSIFALINKYEDDYDIKIVSKKPFHKKIVNDKNVYEKDNILYYKTLDKDIPFITLVESLKKEKNIWTYNEECFSFDDVFCNYRNEINENIEETGLFYCKVDFCCFSTYTTEGLEYDGDFNIEILKKVI